MAKTEAIVVETREALVAAQASNPQAIVILDHGDGTRTIAKPGTPEVRVRTLEPRYTDK